MGDIDFDEKQYLGYNKASLSMRIFLAIFCFTLAWFTDSPAINGGLLFLLGIVILAVSVILLFVTHLRTQINNDKLILTRMLRTYKLVIDISELQKVEKIKYSKYLINYPAYNLHYKNTIRFYTGGDFAVKLVMKDGPEYIIGTQQPDRFAEQLEAKIH
jgi:hypothetical protein